jgi:outer membrane protein assembly factor BamB
VLAALTSSCAWPLAGFETGQDRWHVDLSGPGSSAPRFGMDGSHDHGDFASVGDTLYVSGVQAFGIQRNDDLCTPVRGAFLWLCNPKWRTSFAVDAPTVAGGTLYATSDDGKLYAFDAEGCGASVCDPLWSADLGDHLVASGTAVANGVVFVTTEDTVTGALRAFAADGCGQPVCAPLWTSTGWGPYPSPPSVAGGVVYFGSEDGTLLAFDANGCGAASCAPVWQTTLDAGVATQPVVAYGHVVVGTSTGEVVAYALASST